MDNRLDIRILSINRRDEDKLKAFLNVKIGDVAIKGVKLIQGEYGKFLSMPAEKGKNGQFYPIVGLKKEAKYELLDLAVKQYNSKPL